MGKIYPRLLDKQLIFIEKYDPVGNLDISIQTDEIDDWIVCLYYDLLINGEKS
jgi:hypothetical protein